MSKGKAVTAEEYLAMSKTEAERCLAKVIGEFDFRRAATALHGCGWKFAGSEHSPTSEELEEMAKEIVWGVIQRGSGSTVSSGPLMACAMHYDVPEVASITLRLVPVWSSGVFVDGRVLYAKKMRKRTRNASNRKR